MIEKNPMELLSFFASSYQDLENGGYDQIYSTSNATCDKIWDGYRDFTIFADYPYRPEQRAEAIAHLITRVETLASTAIPGLDWARIIDSGQNVHYLHGPRGELVKYFLRWLGEVVSEAPEVSGDDSYFDYYPDNFYFADQVAKELGLEEEVATAKKRIYDWGMYRDEDAISHGYELDGWTGGL